MPTPTYDLFISYSSHDRRWAEKAYTDLGRAFPTISIFWDREAIPPGRPWRTFLTDGIVNTKHLLFFWSQAAKNSNEVEPEISGFEAEVRRTPTLGGSKRVEFSVGLEGMRGAGSADLQGFPMDAYYESSAADRGISSLDSNPGLTEWKRIIRKVGDEVFRLEAARRLIAAIVATAVVRIPLLDQIHSLPQSPTGPTLDEFLTAFRVNWADVRPRYGLNALEWRPFGGAETVVELLEDLRVQANSRLDPAYWFRWEYVDLVEAVTANTVSSLVTSPSVVVLDPISLYDAVSANAFRRLDRYVRQAQSVIVSLAPTRETGEDWIARALRAQSVPLLEDYFEPAIPPLIGEFAKCALNVQRISDIERMVRSRIAWLDLTVRKAEAKQTTGTT
ncbi:MAG TPA: toll/interleukin-1 receptor domain-containing protein [Terriglobia bacterium]|nr:toll/interleukin-1 receptor domain-containing protein [Terriglobia bacterium]